MKTKDVKDGSAFPVVDQSNHTSGTDAPSRNSGDSTAVRTEILSLLVAETQPAKLPNGWRFLKASRKVRQLPDDREGLATALQEKFRADDLVAARVFHRGEDGNLELSPIIGADSSKLVLNLDKEGRPIDAMNARGILSSSGPPCLRFAVRPRSHQAGGEPTRTILASSDDDLQLFCRLGFRCASAAGLDQLRHQEIMRIFGDQARKRKKRPHRYLLAGCQVANLVNAPDELSKRVLSHLWRVEQVYGFDRAIVFEVWWPSEREFDEIRSVLTFGNADLIQARLVHSMKNQRKSPTECWNEILDTAPADLPSARKELLRAIGQAAEVRLPTPARVAAQRFRRSFETAVMGKFYKIVATSADPLEQLSLLMASEFAQQWLSDYAPLIAAERIAAGEHPARDGAIDFDKLHDRLRIVDTLAKLLRIQHRNS